VSAPIPAILRFLRSEVGAILIWFVATVLLAALIFPHLYIAGKQFAVSAQQHEYPAFMEWLAKSAGRAKPERYLSRALMIGGLICLPIVNGRMKPLGLAIFSGGSQLTRRQSFARGWYFLGGFGIAVLVQALLILFLYFFGVLHPKQADWSVGMIVCKAFLPALGAGIIEEFLFRGILFGVWQRACSVVCACVGTSLIFSVCHFLRPASELVIADPSAWYAGFELLDSIFSQASHLQSITPDFLSLMSLGLVLSWCRIKAGSLLLPIGIHAGFVFALKSFSLLCAVDTTELSPYLLGTDAKSGLLPLISLALSFAGCVCLIRWVKRKNPVE
jgi:uncharacterized protein